ncbi:MAG: hypothetical protein ACI9I4_001520 [Neolewinella sp.]|jgi:hypothetical protein
MKHPINLQFKTTLQRLVLLCVTLFFASASYAQEQVKVVVVPLAGDDLRTVYEIGETGPAGGIVYHVTDGGLHGLEASHEDQSGSAVWCSFNENIAGIVNLGSDNADDPNSGAHNTLLIRIACGGATAAGVAGSYKGPNGITTNWYLPNQEELDFLYKQRGVVGGFASSDYWSSSEFGSSNAWGQDFDDGTLFGNSKSVTYGVRAVRAF